MLIWATRVGHRVTDSLVSYEWTNHHLTGHAYMFTCDPFHPVMRLSLVFRGTGYRLPWVYLRHSVDHLQYYFSTSGISLSKNWCTESYLRLNTWQCKSYQSHAGISWRCWIKKLRSSREAADGASRCHANHRIKAAQRSGSFSCLTKFATA